MPDPTARVEYVEMENRVLAVTLSRGRHRGNGVYRQRVTVHVESGPPVSEEEARDLIRRVVQALRKQGLRLIRWGFGEEPTDE